MDFTSVLYHLCLLISLTNAVPIATNWLPNSNKISLGYHPSRGNPICYSGDCVMKGFGAAIFELQYTKSPTGSCLGNVLVPEHVEVSERISFDLLKSFLLYSLKTKATCIPASDVRAKTEKISTFYEYKESYSKSESSGLSLGPISFGSSEETSWMLDNIYKYNYTMYYTSVRLSFVKLTLFAPRLNLTEAFRSVIAGMPCCHVGCETTESYIRKNIFHQFGYTYLNDILLGKFVFTFPECHMVVRYLRWSRSTIDHHQ